MKYKDRFNRVGYVCLLLLLGFFAGCQSDVRFASQRPIIPSTTASSQNKDGKKITYPDVPPTIIHPPATYNSNSERLVQIAKEWIGTPYLYGGNTKEGVDCSGYVKNVYSAIGINLPRTSKQMYDFAAPTTKPSVGDLVFFSKNGKINHVAIYLDENKIIHSASKKGVIIQEIAGTDLEKRLAGYGKVGK